MFIRFAYVINTRNVSEYWTQKSAQEPSLRCSDVKGSKSTLTRMIKLDAFLFCVQSVHVFGFHSIVYYTTGFRERAEGHTHGEAYFIIILSLLWPPRYKARTGKTFLCVM